MLLIKAYYQQEVVHILYGPYFNKLIYFINNLNYEKYVSQIMLNCYFIPEKQLLKMNKQFETSKVKHTMINNIF